ncbi:hypothetical protein HKCCE3408_12940 [Rhodobacterales bacterium HKCCE3408]|nr:hypothetical protein [Rhodobacterales bacterium HKCCE3408]
MDYGMRLTRHILAQVFGNIGEAARLSAVPVTLLALVVYWAFVGNAEFFTGQASGDPDAMPGAGEIPQAPGRFFILSLVALFVLSWIAVAWHRYVLVEDRPGLMPALTPARILGYIWRTFLIGMIIILILIPVVLLLGGLISAGAAPVVFILGLGLNFLGQWIFVRWALVLPAWAVDRPLRLSESWAATKDVSGEILVPIIGLAVIFTIVQQVLTLLPGGIVALVLFLGVYWLQTLLNLSLLTTLYGNRIEGRELN